MEPLQQQVSRVRRRLILQQFASVVTWSLFACLLAAVAGLAVTKIWALQVNHQVWMWSWIGGALGLGFLIAAVWTWITRVKPIEAAVELDHRFGLKERVSSSLALTDEELETEIGQALVNDAARRVSQVDVSEGFRFRLSRRVLLPLLPAIAVFLLALVPDAQPEQQAQAGTEAKKLKDQLAKSTKDLKRKLDEQEKKFADKNLKDATDLFKKLQEGIDQLNQSDDTKRKDAMLKMNELSKEVEKRRREIGAANDLKKRLDQLKDIKQGPADKMAAAMQEGDFQKALDEIKKLQDKLQKGNLTDKEKQQLADQLEEMKKQLDEMKENFDQAKKEMEKKIQQKLAAGDLAGAGELQKKLDQMMAQNERMNQLGKMAQEMADAADALKNGDAQQAMEQLSKMADNLQQMQNEFDQLQEMNPEQLAELEASLDDILDELAMSKNAMNCKNCGGLGCAQCQGRGKGQGQGNGLGEGQGEGERPLEETDTSNYNSQVGAKPNAGPAVAVGQANGPNVAGQSKEDVQAEIQTSLAEEPEPSYNERLPKEQLEHTKEYYERFREGR